MPFFLQGESGTFCVCVRQRQFLRPVGRPVSAGNGSCGYEAAVREVANIAATTCELIDSARPGAARQEEVLWRGRPAQLPSASGTEHVFGWTGRTIDAPWSFSGESCHPGFHSR